MFTLDTTTDLKLVAKEGFVRVYESQPTHISRAPGRINIIGEHTDYNDGFVLPAAINRAVHIAGRVRADNRVQLHSLDFHTDALFSLDQLRAPELPSWTRYARGVLWVMQERGHKLRGMDLCIVSSVPGGAGFSSSAAFVIAMIEMVCALNAITLDQKTKALLGVAVENEFIKVRTGAMDQLISALGQPDHAILIDCRNYETRAVPIPSTVTLVALDTGKRRELENTEYGLRREQCERAAKLLGVDALRDISPAELASSADKLNDEVLERRARHVVNENARTLTAVGALMASDLKTVGRLMNESHYSLSKLYEVSIRELDIMAEIAQHEKGCYGARMMGGGFGGAVLALVDDSMVETLTQNIAEAFDAATHLRAFIYPVKIGDGSSVEVL